jgi:hypothetical protein
MDGRYNMIEYEEWYLSTDVHEGVGIYYNFFWDLGGDEVEMLSIEQGVLVTQYVKGTKQELEEDIFDNYELEPMDIWPYVETIIRKVFGD